MSDTKVLRWGIMGAGKVSSDFVNAIKQVQGAQCVAVGARSQQSADAFAKSHDISKSYGSYAEVATDSNVDVVYVGTIHPAHKECALLALNAGKHTVVEKPMTMNYNDTKELVDLARTKKVFLMEGFWTRFFPAVVKVRELIANGEIGDPVMVMSDFGFKAPPEAGRLMDKKMGGGATLDIGCYPTAFVTMVFGDQDPTNVAASGAMGETGVDIAVGASITYGNKIGVVTWNLQAGTPEETKIIGPKGIITIHAPSHCPTSITIKTKDEGSRDTAGKVQTFDFELPSAPEGAQLNFPHSEGFQHEVSAVGEAISKGQLEMPCMPLSQSLAEAKILDNILAQVGVKYD